MPEHYDFILRDGLDRFDEVWTDDLQMRDDLERLADATRRRIRFRFLTQALAFVPPADRDPRACSRQRWAEATVSLIASRKQVSMLCLALLSHVSFALPLSRALVATAPCKAWLPF